MVGASLDDEDDMGAAANVGVSLECLLTDDAAGDEVRLEAGPTLMKGVAEGASAGICMTS